VLTYRSCADQPEINKAVASSGNFFMVGFAKK